MSSSLPTGEAASGEAASSGAAPAVPTAEDGRPLTILERDPLDVVKNMGSWGLRPDLTLSDWVQNPTTWPRELFISAGLPPALLHTLIVLRRSYERYLFDYYRVWRVCCLLGDAGVSSSKISIWQLHRIQISIAISIAILCLVQQIALAQIEGMFTPVGTMH